MKNEFQSGNALKDCSQKVGDHVHGKHARRVTTALHQDADKRVDEPA